MDKYNLSFQNKCLEKEYQTHVWTQLKGLFTRNMIIISIFFFVALIVRFMQGHYFPVVVSLISIIAFQVLLILARRKVDQFNNSLVISSLIMGFSFFARLYSYYLDISLDREPDKTKIVILVLQLSQGMNHLLLGSNFRTNCFVNAVSIFPGVLIHILYGSIDVANDAGLLVSFIFNSLMIYSVEKMKRTHYLEEKQKNFVYSYLNRSQKFSVIKTELDEEKRKFIFSSENDQKIHQFNINNQNEFTQLIREIKNTNILTLEVLLFHILKDSQQDLLSFFKQKQIKLKTFSRNEFKINMILKEDIIQVTIFPCYPQAIIVLENQNQQETINKLTSQVQKCQNELQESNELQKFNSKNQQHSLIQSTFKIIHYYLTNQMVNLLFIVYSFRIKNTFQPKFLIH